MHPAPNKSFALKEVFFCFKNYFRKKPQISYTEDWLPKQY